MPSGATRTHKRETNQKKEEEKRFGPDLIAVDPSSAPGRPLRARASWVTGFRDCASVASATKSRPSCRALTRSSSDRR